MPRRNKNASQKFDTRLSFTELCNRAGIYVRQRLLLTRWYKQRMGERNGYVNGKFRAQKWAKGGELK